MAQVRVTADTVQLRLTRGEKIGALSGDLDVPRTAIAEVDVVADGLAAAKGLRAPGLELPGIVKLGTWRGRSGKRFVAVRRKVPTLRLRLTGFRYDTVLVSTDDAAALAASLRASSTA